MQKESAVSIAVFPADHEIPAAPAGANGDGGGPVAPARDLSFHRIATIGLTLMGFTGLFIGLSHLLNDHRALAFILAFCIQGLAVSAIHAWKQARRTGGSFKLLRGGRSLVLYVILTAVIVTMSYSFWYRLQRAGEAANDLFIGQKQAMLGKLTQLEARYKAVADGFAALSDAATARALEEKDNGNTCKIASPKGPGPIQQFRTRDAHDFRDYAAQVSGNVADITGRGEMLRTQAMSQAMKIKATESALNEMVDQINAGLIGNPMLPGVVQFIDGRLLAADNINYFGKTVKCEDEQRTAQLIALKTAVKEIMAEKPLPGVKLLNPESTYENAMLAANRIGALIEWITSFSGVKLSDLDPSIRNAKLSNGLKVYVAADYWPLLFAAVIELVLFWVVPAPRRDEEIRDFIAALIRGNEHVLAWRNARTLLWLVISTPVDGAEIEEPSRTKALELPAKFVRLRPYLHCHKNCYYLVIPHVPATALVHDYASAVSLKGHAKTIVEEWYAVGTLPSKLWSHRLLYLLGYWDEATSPGSNTALTTVDDFGSPYDVPVRVMKVSPEFFAWVIGRVVELDEEELKPDPPLRRKWA